ncbi:MAG: sodium:proton antiporter [Alcanivoracaceae bacterium]|jgi:NhaP-type Na+/H+ or K+/H+ antiporter|nr:sodium:proton antiporter [Alcanivoracaceae bacterium]
MDLGIALQLALITAIAFVCQWAAWRIKLPAILPLLLSGIAIGPLLGLLDPNEMFGDLLLPGVSLAVAIILFEGAMTLKLDEIKGLETTVRRLVTWGALITWAVITTAAVYIVEMEFELALLFGALVTVTGPTVIVPLLRSVRPVASVSRLLRWEGIVIDPLGALLAVLAYELIVVAGGPAGGIGHSLWLFLQTIFLGAAVGLVAAWALAELLKRHLVPEFLRSFLVLSAVVAQFVVSNELKEESGLVAVTVCGMVLTNWRGVRTEDILHFKENLSVILISGLFIVLAARLRMEEIAALGGVALLMLCVVQFIARPLSVIVSTAGSSLNWREKALLSWVAPRGIVAAAISALFAERLAQQPGAPEGVATLVPLTFMMIIGTVSLQSLTARALAKRLDVAEPAPRGVFIVGANPVARAIGTALQKYGYPVLLSDSSWEMIRSARMAGLGTFYGNPVSAYADQSLDLVGLGRLMGLSQRRELNALATMRYRLEFGEQNVYSLASPTDSDEKHTVAPEHRGGTLFSADLTYGKLASALSKGAEIKRTKLTEEFTFDSYMATSERQIWPLFAIDTRERLHVFTEEVQPRLGAGWQIISLVLEEDNPDKKETATESARALSA